MPTYEYHCNGCDQEFEAEQRITEDPIKSCPDCKSKKVKRLISKTSFHLKGGGWYSDLYTSSKGGDKSSEKDSSPKSSDSTDSKSNSKDSKKDTTKSESKNKNKPAKKSTG
jgi:putative FmdB family regulatory protein